MFFNNRDHFFLEFLTHETTCASEMPEKTTCRLGQCRQAPAAVAVAGT
jgi:hypothetical protein